MSVALTSCLEVDDDGSKEVAAAVNAQTQAIQDQNNLIQQQNDQNNVTTTFFGSVVNARDGAPVTGATLRVSSAGTVLLEGVIAPQGEFTLPDLPMSTSVVVEVMSDTDEFLPRAFYFSTGAATQDIQTDIGRLAVSVGVEKTISVTDDNNEPVAGLEFLAFSHVGTGFNFELFAHRSEFDEATGTYRITVPRDLGTIFARALLDLDQDGGDDFFLDDVLSNATISSGRLSVPLVAAQIGVDIPLVRVSPDNTIEFRFAILSQLGLPLENARVNLQDDNAGTAVSTFDGTTGQHVLTTVFDGDLTFLIPAFVEGNVQYTSTQVRVTAAGGGNLLVSGTNTFDVVRSDVINIPVTTFNQGSPGVDDDARLLISQVNPEDSSLRLFYTEAVSIDPAEVELSFLNGVTAIRGDASDEDAVPNGTTMFLSGEDVPVLLDFSLGNTQATLRPGQALIPGLNYRYTIGAVVTTRTNSSQDDSSDNVSFSTARSDEGFSINDIILDNNNFTTNGQPIVATTSDGVPSTATNQQRGVSIMLPPSAAGLDNLRFTAVSSIVNGVSSTSNFSLTLVQQGNVFGSSFVRSVPTANNEVTTGSTIRAIQGSTVPEGEYRYQSLGFFQSLSDNTEASENSITFVYELTRSNGVEESGTITLPVR